MDTRQVLNHHLNAVQARDLEATLADYTEDSVVITTGNVLRGVEALRDWFAAAFEGDFEPGAQIVIDSVDLAGEYALVTWHTQSDGGGISFAVTSYHVRDGKIVMHSGGFVRE